jgi:hypothetical protein
MPELDDLIESLQEIDPEAVIAQHGPFVLTKTGMLSTGDPTFEEWEAALQWSQKVEKYSPFWVGDLIAYGEGKYGEMYAQAMDATGLEYGTLANSVYVARAVPADRRRPAIAFGFHQEVAPLPPSEQEHWLAEAEVKGLSQTQLRHAIKIAKVEATGKALDCWLSVHCADPADQAELAGRMQAEGRSVKMHIKELAAP